MQTTQERTLIVGVELTSRGRTQSASNEPLVDAEESLEELAVLTESAGGVVLGRMLQQRRSHLGWVG
jgi:50S ribosomal subunit-associated GTPase HflX